jgi:hypothetical protein
LPVYGKFKVRNKKDKEVKKLLRREKTRTKETIRFLRKRDRLLEKLRILRGGLYANCCAIYVYWIELNNGLPLKK